MVTNNMHNLTTLIKRLEAATARLEDIASSTIELPRAPEFQQTVTSPSSSSPLPPPVVAVSPAPTAPAAPPPPPVEELPESIEDYDAFLAGAVAKYVDLSNKHGGVVADQAAKVLEGFQAQRTFLLITTKAKKPDMTGAEMAVFQDLLKPINEALMAAGELKDANRGSPDFNHLSAVAEGIMVLAWVTVDNRPYKHVEESLGSAQFFGNRVLKEFKDKDPQQVEWVQAYYQIFRDLTDYVKQNFNNGIPWNPKGLPAREVAASVAAASAPAAASASASAPAPPPAPAAGGPPPPPPPPPPGPPPVLQIKDDSAPAAGSGASAARGAVFAEINKGEAVTAGLRKVDKSQMTHKNPALRAGSTVPGGGGGLRGKSPVPGKKPPKPESMRGKKPARKELDGNKWTIENYDKEAVAALGGGPIEIEATLNQSILISKTSNTTVIVRGKANAVTIENTSRLSLVVDSLVSSVDAVKSQNLALQVLGVIPTIMLDQVDGAQVYLSKESTATQVFMSKTDGVNLNVLDGAGEDGDEGDYKEVPLPSQICAYYDAAKGGLVSEIVAHAG